MRFRCREASAIASDALAIVKVQLGAIFINLNDFRSFFSLAIFCARIWNNAGRMPAVHWLGWPNLAATQWAASCCGFCYHYNRSHIMALTVYWAENGRGWESCVDTRPTANRAVECTFSHIFTAHLNAYCDHFAACMPETIEMRTKKKECDRKYFKGFCFFFQNGKKRQIYLRGVSARRIFCVCVVSCVFDYAAKAWLCSLSSN